ncbi:hypothetical protein PV327_011094 [Microctonus hyperodae]|uniref:Uncharacterized protein n=1 Tax=Microctonus hyperodae TaxID=165561 RepID=A0AA39C7Q8_MICHY|nr:hypothetical protein PV327_011094 [Microctonus hyperodae]
MKRIVNLTQLFIRWCIRNNTAELVNKRCLILFAFPHSKMFALTLFSDGVYYICKKVDIIKGHEDCSIKYKDGKRYAGNVISYNDNIGNTNLKVKKMKKTSAKKSIVTEYTGDEKNGQSNASKNTLNACERTKKSKRNRDKLQKKNHIIELEKGNNINDESQRDNIENTNLKVDKKRKTAKKSIVTEYTIDEENEQSNASTNTSNACESTKKSKTSQDKSQKRSHIMDTIIENQYQCDAAKNTISDYSVNDKTMHKVKPVNINDVVANIEKVDHDNIDETKKVVVIEANIEKIDHDNLYEYEKIVAIETNIENIDHYNIDETEKIVVIEANIENIGHDNFDENKKIVVIENDQCHSDIKNTSACDPTSISKLTSNRKPRIISDVIVSSLYNGHLKNTNISKDVTDRFISMDVNNIKCMISSFPDNNIQNGNQYRQKCEKSNIKMENVVKTFTVMSNVDLTESNQQEYHQFSFSDDFNDVREDMTVSFDLPNVQETSSLLEFANNMNQSSNLQDISFSQSIHLENPETEDNDNDNSCRISSNDTSDSSYHPDTDESSDHDIIVPRNSTTSMKENNNDSYTTQNNTTLEVSTSFKYSAPDDVNMVVKTVESGTKKDFCVYCQTEQTKLYRHLQRKHKDVKEVKDLSAYAKLHPERRTLIKKNRKDGQYLFNTNPDINTRELKVMRPPNVKYNKNASDFALCPQCKEEIYIDKISNRIHKSACQILRERVIPTMRDDNITKAIRYDELAIEFGNKLCEKYRDPHHYDMIRQKLRQIGRLLLELKNEKDGIDDLFSVFIPQNYDVCLTVIRRLAGLNELETSFKTPSLATSLGTLSKQVCNRCIFILTKQGKKEERKLAEEFLICLTEDYSSSIARTAVETQFRNKRHNKKLLPSQDDIQKLEHHLSHAMKTAYDSLKQTFSSNSWVKLAESCLLSIQHFNRRRAGEIERALIEDFNNHQRVNESTIGTSYQSLNKDERRAAEKYVRFTMRGKLGRTVPVLIHNQMLENLQLLLNCRKKAKVDPKNPYLFGISGTLKGDYRYLRACDLMRKYSEECGAKYQERLRGTNLRKHIATMCTNLNLQDHEVSDLATFMGHADKIHKEHYRQPILSREIFQISKLLEIVHPNNNDEDEEESDEETNNFEYNNSSRISTSEQPNTSQKKRSRSPFGKCAHRRWTEQEKNIVSKAFSHYISVTSISLPTFKEINKLKAENHELLLHRSCSIIKAWVNNQRNKLKK